MSLYAGLAEVDEALWAISRTPPPYSLSDNGSTFWPPECHFATSPEEWPFVAEAWDRYEFPEDRRRILERQNLVRCLHETWVPRARPIRCGAQFQLGDARAHQDEHHPGEKVPLEFVHQAWTYELMGFPELYYGSPRGWRTILDPRDPEIRQWEADALELGTAVADYFWRAEP